MIKVCAARYNHDVKEIYLSKKVHTWCLKALGIEKDQLTAVHPLRVEASHRSFYRLVTQSGSWVLMVSPPELEKNDQFLRIAKLFSSHHLPVPTQISHDTALGCYLMNDLGEIHLAQTYTTPAQPAAMTTAINVIHDIAIIQHPDLPNYSQSQFFNELDLFNEWFLQALLQTNPAREDYAVTFQLLVAATQEQPQSCIHMDYHSRNLLYNQGALGIVDFQDARKGPRLYDIATLLHDCYHEFPAPQVKYWLNVFLQHPSAMVDFAHIEPKQIEYWFTFTAIQRLLKAIGIFSRLHLRDSKSSHLVHILPVLKRTASLCQGYAELSSLNMQLNSCIKIAGIKMKAQ